tara:strand:- start:218 stop:682 length:465 start_codon:yes stop_codon:yes gene_type:complete
MVLKNRRQLGSTLDNTAGGGNLQRAATIAANGDMMQSLQGVIGTQATPSVIADATLIMTAAEAAVGIVTQTPTVNRAVVAEAASNWFTAFNLTDVNDSGEFSYINLTAATYTLTLSGVDGTITLSGSGLVNPATSGRFRVVKTSTTNVVLYRLS